MAQYFKFLKHDVYDRHDHGMHLVFYTPAFILQYLAILWNAASHISKTREPSPRGDFGRPSFSGIHELS